MQCETDWDGLCEVPAEYLLKTQMLRNPGGYVVELCRGHLLEWLGDCVWPNREVTITPLEVRGR